MKRPLITGAAVLVLVVLGVGAYVGWQWYQKKLSWTPFEAKRVAYAAPGALEVVHRALGDRHSYGGHLMLTDCDTLSAGLNASAENPPTVTLLLSIYRPDEGCDPRATQPFEQEFLASMSLPDVTPTFGGVLINDQRAEYTLREE